jgi:hypothetical protein
LAWVAARLAHQAIETGTEDPDALWMGGWGMINLAGEAAAGLRLCHANGSRKGCSQG